jgi:L-2-hydroxyglutarate oxidase
VKRHDAVIIGGGIVGMATAWALAQHGLQVLVLEAEEKLAAHQSTHNSGVIHSGLYYRPGSIKAKLCVTGRDATYRFCAENGVAYERCGKLVIATQERDLHALDELEARGKANGLTDLRRLSAEQIREREPHAAGIAGLWVGETGIVDYGEVTRALAKCFKERGGAIELGRRFLGCRQEASQLVLETTGGELACRVLVNCGGLWSDRIARRCGIEPDVSIIPFRGEYYELIPERRLLVKSLIYPVPDPELPFLGVHFTRTIHGGVEAGPNAVLALARAGYRWSDISVGDLWEMARFGGFWRMAKANWRSGVRELERSWNLNRLVRCLEELVPEVRADDLRPGGTGVRAQAVDRQGRLIDDFRIIESGRMVHVLNAPSPAATAALAIGSEIAKRVLEGLSVKR